MRGNEKERRGIGKEKRKKGEKTRSWNSFNRLIILFKAVVSLSVLLSVAFWCNQPLFGRIMNSLWKKEEKRRSKRSSPFASEEPDSSFCKIKRSLHCWMLSHTPVDFIRKFALCWTIDFEVRGSWSHTYFWFVRYLNRIVFPLIFPFLQHNLEFLDWKKKLFFYIFILNFYEWYRISLK